MLIGHPILTKAKSIELCKAFIAGAPKDATGDVFYGVNDSNMKKFRESKNFYYIDNSYFDSTRQEYFRITRKSVQPIEIKPSNGTRFDRLGIEIKPWRTNGEHIILCPQSDSFMRDIAQYDFGTFGNWTENEVKMLRYYTDRPFVIREWNSDKAALGKTLKEDLKNAWCLVTWSSAAAITAILEGIPAISTGISAAYKMGYVREKINDPFLPNNRYEWAYWLADNQFTISEMRDGTAWKMLHD